MKYLLSKVFELTTRLRVLVYRMGLVPIRELGHPVISVGNLTVGGTGKTPLVCFLACELKKKGYQPVVLSRGYQGSYQGPTLLVSDGQKTFCSAEESGDEPYLMAQTLKGVPIVVGKNRFQAGRCVENKYERLIYILDDGYQHLQLKRNLNILVVDGTDPFSNYRLLPCGRLREPLKAIERADSIVITRSHIASNPHELEAEIRQWNPRVPITHFYHNVTGLYDLKNGQRFRTRDFLAKPVVALAAIGNPQVFLHDLHHYQIKVVEQFLFRDHHRYTQDELNDIRRRRREVQAVALVTTEKDAVRLQHLDFEEGEIFAAQIEFQPENSADYQKNFLSDLEFILKSR